tara:strand:- start:221 stop:1735 length:1515 start_codon:yes stop_codon:yes gene_type:complete
MDFSELANSYLSSLGLQRRMFGSRGAHTSARKKKYKQRLGEISPIIEKILQGGVLNDAETAKLNDLGVKTPTPEDILMKSGADNPLELYKKYIERQANIGASIEKQGPDRNAFRLTKETPKETPTKKTSTVSSGGEPPAGTSLSLDPSGNLVSTAPKLGFDDQGNIVSKIGGVEPPTAKPNKLASSIKQAVNTKKGKPTSTTATSTTATSTTSKPSGKGMSLGSGSSLDYLRSEEEVAARNKEVRDRMGKEQKSRRLDAEARFRERRDFIEQGKKIEDPNLIKGQGGRELGRVIKDRTGKIVGSSLNKLGKAALGNRQRMGVVDSSVPDASKFDGTPLQKTMRAYAELDKRDKGMKNITDTQKDVTKMFYGGLDSKQQARVNRASQRNVPLETPKESPFEFQGDKNKAPLMGSPSVGNIPTAPNNLAGRNALNNMIKTARQKRTEGFNFDPEVENMLQKNEAKRAEEEDRMISIVESGEPMDDRQLNEEYDKIFKKGRTIRKGL